MHRLALALPLCLFMPALAAGTLLVGNKSADSVLLVAWPGGATVATLPTGAGPHEIAVSPDGHTAVVTDYGRQGAPGKTLTVLDIPAAKVVRTIDLGAHRRPHGVAWLPDGKRVIVTVEDNRAVVLVDVVAGEVERAIATDRDGTHMVALAPDGRTAWTANLGSGGVTALDLVAGAKLGDVDTGAQAEGIDVAPDGREVWVTNRAAGTVSVIDAATRQVVATLGAGRFAIRAKFLRGGSQVAVTNAQDDTLWVYDAKTREVVKKLPLALDSVVGEQRLLNFGASGVPIGILPTPDGKTLFVAHSRGDAVSVVDTAVWERVRVLKIGKEPDALGYSPLAAAATSK